MPPKIDVIVKRSDEPIGHKTAVSPRMENLQRIVDGDVQMMNFGEFAVLCDEDGKLRQKPYNCTINGIVFVGDILIVGIENGAFSDCPITYKRWKGIINA